MKTLRLLPIVLFATSALLVLKLVGLATGAGSFALGPVAAVAAGDGGHGGEAEGGHGAAKPADAESIEDPIILGAPLDLAKEAEALAKQQEGGGHGGGHGAPAEGGHGEAAPAEGGHGEAAPAEGGHGEAAPAAGEHGAAAPAEGGHGEAVPAAGEHAAAPAEGGHGEAAPAAGEHGAAPAEGGHAAPAEGGHGAPAEGGHGSSGPKLPEGVSTVRPEEYQPPGSTSEAAVLEALGKRRDELDRRQQEIDVRMKLLRAAEIRLQQRVDELKSIENQLNTVPGGGGAAAGQGGAAAPGAAAAEQEDEQIKGLVQLYEAMKPKAAAEVFNSLDVSVLTAIARKMNPRKLSPILAAMAPTKAARLTLLLAGDQGPRQIVVRMTDEPSSQAPLAIPLVPGGTPDEMTIPVPESGGDAGPTDPAALPKIQPAPNG
ncbi:MotE family protein [Oharaeibacter diazotrophicus]|uniref:Flagellar motility protein MotE (MotC chaperone) n=2 Tax=Oharaeibacter diazotrophicus TaxID=1920512 RepID=A0A4R6RLT9_9HYPH|nr:hypothetical protein [Oharaeibacter diazotrophicus]TDP87631.1 hypothetical protein EDD54_1530 [Oharaeibacter diazotrophicus]BBE74786.1 hypothetical protein OHA_1_04423 [Pleomorphomonas sp. SM30]GLS77168.1 hypothetical protein GCM10007904_25050 [Oharaeibacter diazotrophicus]